MQSSFRDFIPAGKGYWSSASENEWNDWNWQLRNRVNRIDQLSSKITLTPDEQAGVALSESKLAMGITPHFFNLIDPHDPHCPIRQQVIPRSAEMTLSPGELADPCGEDASMPVPGLVHRYPDRVLFLVTDRCASYCRYCTRSRVVSGVGEQHLETDFTRAIRYLKEHTEIRDVLLSGGDPLLLSDQKLFTILKSIRDIPHIEFIRIGSRIPIFLPQRITPQLVDMLKQFHPLWMSVHTNHPKELTTEVQAALGRLADAGIPLGNQAVLLKGINDDPEILKTLFQKLLRCRVRPYYLYQCDLIQGSAHFRVPIQRGLEIMEQIRGHTTGYAVPQYVVDGPGGGGKIPLNPDYVVAKEPDRWILKNYKGELFEYHEAPTEVESEVKTATEDMAF
ncbi:MAG: KamA family radical SAM protein [Verrucomicrobiota bacterium]